MRGVFGTREFVQSEDPSRCARLGMAPAMQPWHMLHDMADLTILAGKVV